MSYKIAVMGAGAMGTLLGAVLASKGQHIELIDVDKAHVDALNRDGATVEGTIKLHARVCALTPDKIEGTYDLVFLMVKQTHNESALKGLLPHLHVDSVVCTLQNGLPEPVVARMVGDERTLGCAVTWAATAIRPGATLATSPEENWHSLLGRPDGKITPKVRAVREMLALMCPTEITENLTGIRWSKLLVNSSISGVSTALGCTFGGLFAQPEALRCVQEVARECVRVARALGVSLEPLAPNENFNELMNFTSEVERLEKSKYFYKILGGADNPGKASMLQDLERGRKTEVDSINLVLQQGGKAAGVPTPRCDRVISLIREMEQGTRIPSMDNLAVLLGD